jgi:hypothetical protein
MTARCSPIANADGTLSSFFFNLHAWIWDKRGVADPGSGTFWLLYPQPIFLGADPGSATHISGSLSESFLGKKYRTVIRCQLAQTFISTRSKIKKFLMSQH